MSPSPPPAFDDFQFFNPALHNLLPSPPPLPPSADLFSASETTDFLGFLENFNWEFEVDPQDTLHSSIQYPDHNPRFDDLPPPPLAAHNERVKSYPPPAEREPAPADMRPDTTATTSTSSSLSPPLDPSADTSMLTRVKPPLSTPQKRLNHIMSEQKRRNAIRDGYLQLTTLLAPAGAPPGSGMPTRGRPKGSGSRGRGSKGKSGILFRAREYIQFLEDGREALLQEVLKVEAAADIRH
ncbi:hypothetical protein SCP_0104320 [Sparassis crispa]|uniref:BHLH domain-containing protein n=1 Tax=Sparassis crispa TaxID=139825 RepID=A0A401G5X4_9APHY|nr:hypothetical protein SCP_0104320 [Sparassis crispa]GBE77554.1 hypothetical protein SCP_0104320 [Sparassis crispa]